MRTLVGPVRNRSVPLAPRTQTTSFSLFGTGSGKTVELEVQSQVSTLFTIVGSLANSTASVDWHLYKKPGPIQSRKGAERDEISKHLALDLWNKPNAFMPRNEFVETFQQHIDLTGEAWWHVEKAEATGLPQALWPLRPDRMKPVPGRDTFLAGYIYRTPDGIDIPLDLDEVVFLRSPNAMDLYRGMSAVTPLLVDLQSFALAAAWNRNFFENSAQPGGIIEVPSRMSDEEWTNFKLRWDESHRGSRNAHRVATIENGMKWVDSSFSMKDMQFAELRSVSREIIREAFQFPKFMLGEPEGSNRASAMAAEYQFARQLVRPRLERIKAALNNDFLPLFGSSASGLEFDYDDPEPNDEEATNKAFIDKATALKTLIDAGAEPDEALEYLEMPKMTFKEKPEPIVAPPAPGQEGTSGPGPSPDDAPDDASQQPQ